MCRLHTWVCVLCAILSSSFSGVPRYSSQAGANFCTHTFFWDELQILPAKAKGFFYPCPALINLLLQVSGVGWVCGLDAKVSNLCSVFVCFSSFQRLTSVLFSGWSKLLHFYLFWDELQILPAKATGFFYPCPALINLLLQVSGFG